MENVIRCVDCENAGRSTDSNRRHTCYEMRSNFWGIDVLDKEFPEVSPCKYFSPLTYLGDTIDLRHPSQKGEE